MASDTPAVLRARLLGALLTPGVARDGSAVLALAEDSLAVVELPDEGAAIVIMDAGGADEVERHCAELFRRHAAGTLYIVAVGGGDEIRNALERADRDAPDPNRIGVYHLDAQARLARVAGRKLGTLDAVAKTVATTPPLSLADAPELIARARKERDEAIAFAQGIASRRARVTLALIAACVLIHVGLSSRLGGEAWNVALYLAGANSGPVVREGEIWRLLSHAFLHGSAQHLVMNMIALWSFGSFLERVVGWRRYVLLYVLSALAGGLASALIGGFPLSVGASGAVWGLMAAGFGMVLRRGVLPVRVARGMRQRLVVVLVLNAIVSFIPGIDLYAHFGGGLAGFALALTGVLTPQTDREPRWLTIAAIAAAALAVLSVATAFATGRPWRLLESSPRETASVPCCRPASPSAPPSAPAWTGTGCSAACADTSRAAPS